MLTTMISPWLSKSIFKTYAVKLATIFHHIIPKLNSGHEIEKVNARILLYLIFTSNVSLTKNASKFQRV